MRELFQFYINSKSNWGILQAGVSKAICEFLACGKDFEIEFRETKESKSHSQLKAIYRLFPLLAVRFSESYGTSFDASSAKEAIKWHFGFTREFTDYEATQEATKVKAIYQLETGNKMSKREFLEEINRQKAIGIKAKSFAEATKEEMIEIIAKLNELGLKMGWKEIKVSSEEERALIEAYEKK